MGRIMNMSHIPEIKWVIVIIIAVTIILIGLTALHQEHLRHVEWVSTASCYDLGLALRSSFVANDEYFDRCVENFEPMTDEQLKKILEDKW